MSWVSSQGPEYLSVGPVPGGAAGGLSGNGLFTDSCILVYRFQVISEVSILSNGAGRDWTLEVGLRRVQVLEVLRSYRSPQLHPFYQLQGTRHTLIGQKHAWKWLLLVTNALTTKRGGYTVFTVQATTWQMNVSDNVLRPAIFHHRWTTFTLISLLQGLFI